MRLTSNSPLSLCPVLLAIDCVDAKFVTNRSSSASRSEQGSAGALLIRTLLASKELNPRTRTRTLELLRPTLTVIVIYYQNYIACLSPLEHQELVLTLDEEARKRILAKTQRLRRHLAEQLRHPRSGFS